VFRARKLLGYSYTFIAYMNPIRAWCRRVDAQCISDVSKILTVSIFKAISQNFGTTTYMYTMSTYNLMININKGKFWSESTFP